MTDTRSTRELFDLGFDKYDLRRLVRNGELERIRRGAYGAPLIAAAPREVTHRRLIDATVGLLGDDVVLSHGSAAVLHGLPTWTNWLTRVHVTRSRSTGGQRRSIVHLHVAPLVESDIWMIDGITVTSPARTVLDLARSMPIHQAVAAGDRALADGLDRDQLAEALARMTRWPMVRSARRACTMLDPRSESAGESVSRVRLVEQGLPTPQPQYEVYDHRGRVVARSDFGWEDRRTVGEFDGLVKYGRLLKPGQSVEDVVYAEKLREDAIRDQGWQVVRWTWTDLNRPEVIRDRVLRAFLRAA